MSSISINKKKLVSEEARFRKDLQWLEEDEKAKELKAILEAPNVGTDYKQALANGLKDLKSRENILPFLDGSFGPFVQPCKGTLTLIGANTGGGKSTFAAQYVAGLLQAGKDKILIISNEEPANDIFLRIGCTLFGYSYNDYKTKDTYSLAEKQEILVKSIKACVNKVTVYDSEIKNKATSTVNGLKNILEDAVNKYDAIVIDYFQLVRSFNHEQVTDIYGPLIAFSSYLKDYKGYAGAPILMFAQVHPLSKTNVDDWASRLKLCRDIANNVTDAYIFERKEDSRNGLLVCKKDRNTGQQGKVALTDYVNGKIVCSIVGYMDDVKDFQVRTHQRQHLPPKVVKMLDDL